jgi:hypothetical protein
MGLGLNIHKACKNNSTNLSEEIAYFGKSYYPLHHWIVGHTGDSLDCDYGEERELTKETLLLLRDEFIDLLQNATDGNIVTDKEYIKKRLVIWEDEDIDEYFVGFIIDIIDMANRAIYQTDFENEVIFYYPS